jgi:hypothetical protein
LKFFANFAAFLRALRDTGFHFPTEEEPLTAKSPKGNPPSRKEIQNHAPLEDSVNTT